MSTSSSSPLFSLSSAFVPRNPNSGSITPSALSGRIVRRGRILAQAAGDEKQTRLVTFLGKGGSGKTTSAVLAAQHYAMEGLNTCLVVHSQDPTAEFLLNRKLGAAPTKLNNHLSAVRLETTKMLLEPLKKLKQADASLNLTQGVLEGVVGEELGVLPGMDSLFSALALERLVGFFGIVAQKNHQQEKFDIIVYDGISTEEFLRLAGVCSKARLYLKYMRQLADKTDFGRLAGPSLLRLVDESVGLTSQGSSLSVKTSGEIWETFERGLERGSSAFMDPLKVACYLMMNVECPASVNTALRFWGCTIQAGGQVFGSISFANPRIHLEQVETAKRVFAPLPLELMPHVSFGSYPDWSTIVPNSLSDKLKHLLSNTKNDSSKVIPPVKFDANKKSVTLFMPGFDKSEIKLYQYRGGSELLVEAGDQRRVIDLPSGIQGKVGGAKFSDRCLVVTMR
uniref:Uncharacterized protein n=2 Tax=Kalanchoe fedtschenkoi TaxID=63787 RepID=A0A7N0ZTM8_KALFE